MEQIADGERDPVACAVDNSSIKMDRELRGLAFRNRICKSADAKDTSAREYELYDKQGKHALEVPLATTKCILYHI